MALIKFLQEYKAATYKNPFCDEERVWEDKAAFTLRAWSEVVRLSGIRSLFRRMGHGSEALKWLCDLADKHQVSLSGYIYPCSKKPRLTKRQLRAWYRKNGFVVDKTDNIFRKPKGVSSDGNDSENSGTRIS